MSKAVKKGIEPRLRFPEFKKAGDWEVSSIGEMAKTYSGGTPTTGRKEYYGGDIPFIRSAEINSTSTELFLTDEGLRSSSAKMVEVGDVLYALYGANSGDVAISKINGAINQAILCIKSENKNEHIFQFLSFRKDAILAKYLQGGQGNLSGEIVKTIKIPFPIDKNEQKKIAACLSSLDDVITAQGEKVEALKTYKKGLLQQLFPQEGQTTPLLRFPEFKNDGDWKREPLNHLLYEAKQRNRDLKYGKEHVLSVSGELGCVNQIELLGRSYAGVSVHNYHVVEVGDIVYTKSPLKRNPYGIIKENKGTAGIVSTLYAVYRPTDQCNSAFLDYYFSDDFYLNSYLQPLVKKGAKNDMKVNNAYVLTGEVPVPPTVKEQKKISDFLGALENLIMIEKNLWNNVKDHKKGLLQQLFPIVESKVE